MVLSWLHTRDSISSNPVASNITVNDHGTSFAWAILAIQVLVFSGLSCHTFFFVNRGNRAFTYLVAAVLACNALNWFALASNLGAVPVSIEFYAGVWGGRGNGHNSTATRSIWISRYVDWFVSTPFVIIAVLLVSPVPLSTIFITVFWSVFAVLCGLVGALTYSQYKWGWFVFGVCAMTWVVWVLVGPALLAAKKAGKDVFWAYVPVVAGFGTAAILYIIAWAVAEGSNVISPDSEFVYYGVLDLVFKSFCLSYHVFSVSGVEYERFGLFSSKASIFASPEALPGVAATTAADGTAAEAGAVEGTTGKSTEYTTTTKIVEQPVVQHTEQA